MRSVVIVVVPPHHRLTARRQQNMSRAKGKREEDGRRRRAKSHFAEEEKRKTSYISPERDSTLSLSLYYVVVVNFIFLLPKDFFLFDFFSLLLASRNCPSINRYWIRFPSLLFLLLLDVFVCIAVKYFAGWKRSRKEEESARNAKRPRRSWNPPAVRRPSDIGWRERERETRRDSSLESLL